MLYYFSNVIKRVISSLGEFFAKHDVSHIVPYDLPVGAATFHPLFIEHIAMSQPFKIQYPQLCRRPGDSRHGKSVNRMQFFHQYQVVISPRHDEMLNLALQSMEYIGLSKKYNNFELLEDNWASPTLGAYGIGYELRCNGLEILQFTYFQKFGGYDCPISIGELAYGVERIAYILSFNLDKHIDSIICLPWNDHDSVYTQYIQKREKQYYKFNTFQELFNTSHIDAKIEQTHILIEKNLIYPAYDLFIEANHIFNIIDHTLSNSHRQNYLLKLAEVFQSIFVQWRQLK